MLWRASEYCHLMWWCQGLVLESTRLSTAAEMQHHSEGVSWKRKEIEKQSLLSRNSQDKTPCGQLVCLSPSALDTDSKEQTSCYGGSEGRLSGTLHEAPEIAYQTVSGRAPICLSWCLKHLSLAASNLCYCKYFSGVLASSMLYIPSLPFLLLVFCLLLFSIYKKKRELT